LEAGSMQAFMHEKRHTSAMCHPTVTCAS